jgi:nucleotide-binding universal stress UspA family protein
MVPNVVLPSDDEIKNTAVRYLQELEGPFNAAWHKKLKRFVTSAAPAEAIIDYADSGEVDLIAMTTHGFSGFKRWVFGSVTEKILQAGNKPVLLIPNTDK